MDRWIIAFLALIPACINVYILFYSFFNLDRNKLTITFNLLVLAQIFWQLLDFFERISVYSVDAILFSNLLWIGVLAYPALALHFSLLFTERGEKASASKWLTAIYLPPIVFEITQRAGLNEHPLVESELFGWVLGPSENLMHQMEFTWIALACCIATYLLVKYLRTLNKSSVKYKQALLITIGFGVSSLQLTLTEFLFPVVFGYTEVPIASTCMIAVSVTSLVAFRKHQLFQFDPQFAANKIIETMKDGLCVLSNDQRIMYTNSSFERIVGYTKAEIADQRFDKMFLSDNATEEMLQEQINRGIGINESYELEIKHKDPNRMVRIRVSASDINDTSGVRRGTLGVVSDISYEKRIARYKEVASLVSTLPVGYSGQDFELMKYMKDVIAEEIKFERLYFALNNEAGELELVYDYDGRDVAQVPQVSAERDLHKYLQQRRRTTMLRRSQFAEMIKKGDINTHPDCQSWLGVNLSLDGKAVGVLVIQKFEKDHYFSAEDLQLMEFITPTLSQSLSIHGANKKLRESTEKLDGIMNSIDGLVWEFEYPSFEFTFVSQKTEEMFGFAPSEWSNEKGFWMSRIHQDDRISVMLALNDHLARAESFALEYRFLGVDDVPIWIKHVFNSTVQADNKILVRGVLVDITSNKHNEVDLLKNEKELKEKNAELNTFIYRASHDLKGPLSSVIGLTNVAAEDLESLDDAAMYLEMIGKSVQRLDMILEELTQLTVITQSGYVISKFSIDELYQEIVESISHMEGLSHVTLIKEVETDLLLEADQPLLRSILFNTISNAIKYRNEKVDSYLRFNVSVIGDHIVFEIADNGVGVQEDNLPRVFEMFYRGNVRSKGTGLGLYIVKNAVYKMGGTIDMKSERWKGTVVTIKLPTSLLTARDES